MQDYFSRIAETPIPPAVHIDINPFPLPFWFSIFAKDGTILPPVAAKGWSIARELPFTLILLVSTEPKAESRPRFSLQNLGSSHAFNVHNTCAANAS